MREVRLEPTSGVICSWDEWSHPTLGLRVPAPPLLAGDESSQGDLELARLAVDTGMASAKPTGRGNGLFAVELVRALAVPPGVLRAGMATVTHLALTHPLVCLAAMLLTPIGWVLQVHVLWWSCLCLIIFGMSMVVHEAGHVIALRIVAGVQAPAVLLATPTSARLVWRSTGTAADIVVIVAGPLSPLLVALPFGPLLVAAPIAGFAVVVVVLSHLVTLMLRSGDGAELRGVIRSLRGRRYDHDHFDRADG